MERPPIWVMRQGRGSPPLLFPLDHIVWLTCPLLRPQAGRYLPEYHQAKGSRDFFECCRDAEVASTITLQPIERFAGLIDAAIIFSDILVIPQAMGMVVEMVDKKGPNFPQPLKSPDDGQYAEVLARDVDVAKELDYVYRAITLTRQKLQGRVPLIGFCGAPWTLFCYMVEGGGSKMFIQTKTWIYRYPAETRAMLQKIAEICVDYLALQVKAGAQVGGPLNLTGQRGLADDAQLIQVFDSWAGELSPASFKAFSQPYLEYIAQNLPRRLKELELDPVPMIVFPKGAWYSLDVCCSMGYNAVSLDWLHDPAEASRIRGDRPVVLQGNADPGVLYGTHESITEVVENLVKGFGWKEKRKGWIVNLGHGKQPQQSSLRTFGLTCDVRNHSPGEPRRSQVFLPRDSSPNAGIAAVYGESPRRCPPRHLPMYTEKGFPDGGGDWVWEAAVSLRKSHYHIRWAHRGCQSPQPSYFLLVSRPVVCPCDRGGRFQTHHDMFQASLPPRLSHSA